LQITATGCNIATARPYFYNIAAVAQVLQYKAKARLILHLLLISFTMKNNIKASDTPKKSSSEKENNTIQEKKEEALAEEKQGQQLQAEEEEGEDNPFGGLKGAKNFRRNLGCGG
jgi:hypothetical protein